MSKNNNHKRTVWEILQPLRKNNKKNIHIYKSIRFHKNQGLKITTQNTQDKNKNQGLKITTQTTQDKIIYNPPPKWSVGRKPISETQIIKNLSN